MKTEDFTIDYFNKLIVSETFVVKLKEGETPNISITSDSNIIEIIEHTVIDSTLTLHYNKRFSAKNKPIITITYTEEFKTLELKDKSNTETLTTLNSSDFTIINSGNSKGIIAVSNENFTLNSSDKSKLQLTLNTKTAQFNLSNSSKVEGEVNTDTISITQTDRSFNKITGKTKNLTLIASDKTSCKYANFNAVKSSVQAKDNSTIYIYCASNFDLNASGNSETYLYGNPKITIDSFQDKASLIKKGSDKKPLPLIY